MKKFLVMLLALILALGCVSALAEEIDWRALEGGELNMYGGCDEPHVAAVAKAFEEKTGIKVNYIRMSGNDCYNRILEERDNPQGDVWYGGTWDPYIAAADQGLLHEFTDCRHAPYKSENFGVGEPYWFGIYSGYIGFICDAEELEARGLEVPTSWKDLMDPKYEGLIVMANPGATGTGVMTVSILFQLFGDKEKPLAEQQNVLDMIAAMDKNVTTYVKTGSGTSHNVALGEAAIGVGFLHTGLMYIEDGYDNFELVGPEEGTGYEVGGTAIIEGCKHLDEAKLFIQFALTPECQEIGKTVGALQFLTVEGAQDPESAASLLDTKLIDYDSDWTGAHKNEIIEAWNSVISSDKIATE